MTVKDLTTNIDVSLFNDQRITNAAIEVANKALAETYSSPLLKRNAFCNNVRICLRLLQNSTVEDLADVNYVYELVKTKMPRGVLFVHRMLFCLYDQNVLKAPWMKKLLPFRERMTKTGFRNDIKYILSYDGYDEFMNAYADMGQHAIMSFFSNIDDICFADARLQQISARFFSRIKLKRIVPQQICANCVRARELFQAFAGYQIEEISAELIRQRLIKKEKRKWNSMLLDYIKAINEVVPFKDPYITKYIEICSVPEEKLATKFCLKIFDCANPDQLIIKEINHGKSHALWYINTPATSQIFPYLKDFIFNDPSCGRHVGMFLEHFSLSTKTPIESVCELSLQNFKASIKYFQEKNLKKSMYLIKNFYYYCYQKTNIDFFKKDGLDISILTYPELIKCIKNDFDIIKHNPFDPVPSSDKWLILPMLSSEGATEHYNPCMRSVNFTGVKNPLYRSWLKMYLWKTESAIEGKLKQVKDLKESLNYMDSNENPGLTIAFNVHDKTNTITVEKVIKARKHISDIYEGCYAIYKSTLYLYMFMSFLIKNNVPEVNPEVTRFLQSGNRKKENQAKPIPSEDLKKLSRVFEEKSKESLSKYLCNCIYKLLITNHLRLSEIVRLKADCMKSEDIIEYVSKTSHGEPIRVPITSETKNIIEDVLQHTSGIREKCDIEELKQYLFLKDIVRAIPCSRYSAAFFNRYIKECCKEAGIPSYSSGNLRDTYMTQANEYARNNRLVDAERLILFGHTSLETSEKYYIRDDFVKVIEEVNTALQSDVNMLYGTAGIAETDPSCKFKVGNKCKSFYLKCLICDNFVATPDMLPQLETARSKAMFDKDIAFSEDEIAKQETIEELLSLYINTLTEFANKNVDI